MELMDALGLGGGEMVCFIGAGGKSSLLLRLASEYACKGGRVLVTTSAKMFDWQLRETGNLILEPEGKKLFKKLKTALLNSNILAAGSSVTDDHKITGPSKDSLDLLFRQKLFDSILVEADGSRGKSLKAPAGHEPVLPSACTTVIAVVGIDILGCPLTAESVHRHQLAAQITGQDIGSVITEETVCKIIKHYRVLAEKAAGSIKIVPVINKADSQDTVQTARKLACRMLSARIKRVLVTSALKADPVWEVVS